MIQSFQLQNFRCFSSLQTSFKRFNIIVGESGSGKTSLMESLFLLGGSTPEIYFRLRNWRGFSQQVSLAGTKDSYESLFRDMFYDFDQEKGALIGANDSNGGSRKLAISYKRKDEYALPLDELDPNAFLIEPIVFKWEINGKSYDSSLELLEGKAVITGSAPVAPFAYYNPVNISPQQNAAAYSALSRKFKTKEFTKALSILFPYVKEITLEIVGGDAVIHVATDLSERLPLTDVSGGINKFVSIALGITANPNGTIIVDEIENGFYFKNFSSVWGGLTSLSLENNVQMIVTTHSYEFLKAASESLADEEIAKEFQFMRLERSGNGQHTIDRIKAHSFQNAISNDLEVR